MSDEPRAYTADEMRKMFLDSIWQSVRFWQRIENPETDKLEGLAHSILTIIDGCSSAFPCALGLTAEPHPDNKQFRIDEGDNWVEPGMEIGGNNMLHELFYKRDTK